MANHQHLTKEEILEETIETASEEVSLPQQEDDRYQDEEYSKREQRKIIHKVDRRLITGLGLLFAVSLMDRTNLGNASIAGMSKDLELKKGTRYSIVLLVFFAPYVLFQFPSAIIVRKLGPRTFLPCITFFWGVVMLCFGFIHDWKVMIGLRMVLGTLESGLFAGAIYLVSMWYSRYDVHKRYSSFYLISIVGSSASGILAFCFMQMAGLAGLAAWRWIFIMEGLLTIVVAFVGFMLLVNFPQGAHKSWRFLTQKEEAYIIRRINKDRQDADQEAFALGKFLRPALDPKVWGFAMIFFSSTIVAYAIAFFLPLILSGEFGFSIGVSQLLSTPPYIFAACLMYFEGWLGDKYRIRGPIIAYNALQTIVGLCILAWVNNAGVQYFGMFLVASGCNATVPATLAWQANNIRGQWRRAFCSASLISFGGTGGIVGALVFRSQDAPHYLPGIYASLACNILILVLVAVLSLHFHVSNKQVLEGKLVIENLPNFLYTL